MDFLCLFMYTVAMAKKYAYYAMGGILLFLLMALVVVNPYPLIAINLKLTDFMMMHRIYHAPRSHVVVVAVDEKSLEQLGRWPWDRSTLASIINNLSAAHPSAIGLDIVFSEQQHNRTRHLLMRIDGELSTLRGTAGVREDIQQMLTGLPNSDEVLAGSIARAVNVVLGYFFYMSKSQIPVGMDITDMSFAFSQISSSTLPVIRIGTPNIRQAYFPVVNIPTISAASLYKGFFNMSPDPDGVVRDYTLVQIAHGRTFPSFALALASLYTGTQPLVTEDSTGIDSIKLLPQSGSAIRIPVDNYGRMIINYPPTGHAVPVLSAVDVLRNSFPRNLISHRAVLIGVTAPGLYDLRVTPVSNALPGILVHAYTAEQIIDRRFLTDLSQNPLVNILIVIVLAAVLIAAMKKTSSLLFLIELAASALGFIVTVFMLLSYTSTILNIVYPVSAIVLFGIVLSSYKYAVEEKKGRGIRKAFSHYVSPTVVREIIKAPDALKWGGEKKDISILFSDIRGFTRLSAYLMPEQVALLLHEYMTGMTRVILNNEGMLDKYIGDAIMALFGTPLSVADHADRAVSCSMEMRRALEDVNRRLRSLSLPSISIGIGINSGEAIVGNMGSSMLFNYTAIGDHVNIASRLEGLNKYYGTNLIISEYTYDRLPSKEPLCRLDRVIPQGADRPISLYTILPEDIRGFKETYERAVSMYLDGRFQDARTIFSGLSWNFQAARLMEERCAMLATADKATWEGFYRFEKK